MSIIYEALRKVEDKKDVSLPQGVISETNHEGKKQKQPIPKKKNNILLLIFAFFLLLAVFFLDNNLRFKSILPWSTEKSSGLSKTNKRVVVPKKTYKGYVLEGIMYDQEASSAIVNGRVVERNDIIGNFAVTNITQDSVELTNNQTKEVSSLSMPF